MIESEDPLGDDEFDGETHGLACVACEGYARGYLWAKKGRAGCRGWRGWGGKAANGDELSHSMEQLKGVWYISLASLNSPGLDALRRLRLFSKVPYPAFPARTTSIQNMTQQRPRLGTSSIISSNLLRSRFLAFRSIALFSFGCGPGGRRW